MNWRTGVRIGLAAIGLGVAATVFVKSRNGPPPPSLPQSAPKLDPNVSVISGEGKMLSFDGDKLSLEIPYKSSTSYEDGRVRLEGAVIKGLGDRAFTLRTTTLETKGPTTAGARPTHFTLTGHFTFEGSDGMVVEAEAGTYDDTTGVLDIPGAVTFRRGRTTGTSTGAKYDRATDTVNLLAAANATVAPDAQGKGAAQASSSRMSLVRGQHSLLMEENARIVGEAQVMSAHKATLLFTDDESALKFLDLRGAASVTPSSGAAAGQPRMSANDLTMAFHPDGVTMQHATLTGQAVLTTTDAAGSRSINASWIDLFTGKDGQTVTRLEARDKVLVEIPATKTTAARTITSATLTANGDEKRGLTSARFDGSPCFREGGAVASVGSPRASQPRDPGPCAPPASAGAKSPQAPGTGTSRMGSATTLVLKLAGQLDAIQEAEFQQNAKFEDGRVSAESDVAIYNDAKDVLALKPNDARRLSLVKTADLTVQASLINVFLETENLEARGSVKTRTVKSPESKKRAAGSLFEGDEPVYGTADSLDYVKETGKANYLGSARSLAHLTQGKTDIAAIRLEFTESTSNLVGTGQVESAIYMTAPASDSKGEAKPQVYRVKAETLTYDDARRLAVYEAPVVVLTTEDGTRTESGKLTFELAKESRTLDRMRAEGAVVATLPGGYESIGDLLVYRADTDQYNITGKPAVVKSPDKEGNCKKTVSTNLELDRRSGTVTMRGNSPAFNSTEPIGCAESIRIIKK